MGPGRAARSTLGPPLVPNDVIVYLASLLQDLDQRRTLANLGRTSRSMHTMVEPRLYHTVTLATREHWQAILDLLRPGGPDPFPNRPRWSGGGKHAKNSSRGLSGAAKRWLRVLSLVKVLRIGGMVDGRPDDPLRTDLLPGILRRASQTTLLPNLERICLDDALICPADSRRGIYSGQFLNFFGETWISSSATHLAVTPHNPAAPIDLLHVTHASLVRTTLHAIYRRWTTIESVTLHGIHILDFHRLCDFNVAQYRLYLRQTTFDEAAFQPYSTRLSKEPDFASGCGGPLTSFVIHAGPQTMGDSAAAMREREMVDHARDILVEQIEAQTGRWQRDENLSEEYRGEGDDP